MTRTRKAPGGPRALDARPPTIRTVAERAGVAISTVSRVLNGGPASRENQDKVRRAVEALGYVPSRAAQALVSRRTGCVGVVVHSCRGYWFYQLIEGVEEALVASRRSVNLASLRLNGRYDASVVDAWIRERRVDGLVFVRASPREQPLIEAARAVGLPVALVAPDIAAEADIVVRCDNVQAGRLVAQHLLELGHTRIAFAGGPEGSRDTQDRLTGIREELARAGYKVRASDLWFGRDYYAETGADYAKRFLNRARGRPTAVVLANDAMALGFMRVLAEHGVQGTSVAGFDGAPEGAWVWPGLTSVLQPTRRMAASACAGLLARIDGSVDGGSESLEYSVELIRRESTRSPEA